jgi:hypothetical protein
MLVLSSPSRRHLPIIESVVLPLLDQGASYAVHSTPLDRLRAQKHDGNSKQSLKQPDTGSLFHTLKPKHFSKSSQTQAFLEIIMASVAFWTHSPSTR